MEFRITYEDDNLLVVDKSPNIVVFHEKATNQKTLIDLLLNQFPYLKKTGSSPRYGIVHRLDKDTSGILLVAKNEKSLFFLQNQFKNRKVVKKYIALAIGDVKKNQGLIETLIDRSPKDRRKQKVYLPLEPGSEGKRKAITRYKVLKRFFGKSGKKYTLLEVMPKTGRKHQIRAHLKFINHPIVGDKFYGFKDKSPTIDFGEELKRQFLHASFLEIKFLDGKKKEFKSELPEDLTMLLEKLNEFP